MVDANFYDKKENVTLTQVAAVTDSILQNTEKASEIVSDIATMQKAGNTEICFFYDRKSKETAADMRALACVTTADLASFVPKHVAILISENPKMAYIKLNEYMYSLRRPQAGIDATAKIAQSAKIGKNCFIGANVVIGEKVVIGDNCRIEPNVVIEQGCQIGARTRIASNASISYAIIGTDCYIYSGARIGHDGFGFQMMGGQHHRIEQLGRVIIGNDVEIGANTCIDRGALDDTVIGDGCRIDNLV
jgi:UDP-3-O-[3-hydroxymyristoyl] glucosamine N-acyltransferase